MPKYMALIYGPAEPETPADFDTMMAEYMEFGAKAGAAGVILHGDPLQPVAMATTISVTGGKGGDVVTTDGPFAEAKEVLGGYYVLTCADLDDAIHWASQIPGAWHGQVEIRPIMEF